MSKGKWKNRILLTLVPVLLAISMAITGYLPPAAVAEARDIHRGESNVQTVYGRITDHDGNPIVARVELWYAELGRITEELGEEVPERVQFARNLFHAGYSDASGRYYLNAPPGEWLIKVSKGPEWEVKTFGHSVEDIGPRWSVASHRLDVTLRQLYCLEDRGWFSGDLHLHTWHTDGQDTPTEVARAAIGTGLDFAVITDHNTVDPWEEWLAQRTDQFLPIVGEEPTTGSIIEDKAWGHYLVIGTSTLDGGATHPHTPDIMGRYMFNSAEQVQGLIDLTHERGGVFALAHPMPGRDWPGGTISIWDKIRHFDAIEVWNGSESGPHTRSLYPGALWNQSTMGTQVWFEFLNAGNRIAAWGTSDNHNTSGLATGGAVIQRPGIPTYWRWIPGNARTYVRADALNLPEIKDALRNGRAFITSGFGPLLLVESEGKGPGEIVRVGADGKVPLEIEVLSNRPLLDSPRGIRIIQGGKVVEELPTKRVKAMKVDSTIRVEEDSWVVVQVFGEHPAMAMTNAIYLDVAPYGDWDDPEWRVPAGAEEWMNPFPQAPEITVPDGPAEGVRNVILLIGDGMSFSTITATRVYKVGPDGNLAMDTLDHHGWISTHALNSLVTGSASAGTAIATGRKTNNRMVGMLPDGTELESILDIARDLGKSTGLVTTSRITHATPAAFGSSSEDRGNWDDIATDYIFESRPDILLGGGLRFWLDDQAMAYPHFVTDSAKDSRRVVERLVKQGLTEAEAKADDGLLDDARKQGYKTIHTGQELAELNMAALFGEGKKLLGLFALSHMAYEVERKEKAPHEPHLATMTNAALVYLSQDRDGFFLMVEAARIDHAQHGNLAEKMIYDTIAFDEVVRVALDFQRKNPNTLVIVTSDHDCGGMALEWPRGEFPSIGEIPFKDIDLDRKERGATMTTRELLAKLDELEAAGTLDSEILVHIKGLLYRDGVWTSGDHTAVDVPIMATGPGAERVSGRMDNTDVFWVMKEAMK